VQTKIILLFFKIVFVTFKFSKNFFLYCKTNRKTAKCVFKIVKTLKMYGARNWKCGCTLSQKFRHVEKSFILKNENLLYERKNFIEWTHLVTYSEKNFIDCFIASTDFWDSVQINFDIFPSFWILFPADIERDMWWDEVWLSDRKDCINIFHSLWDEIFFIIS
jgi:hypothetical protein